jgi:hypothetical protein
MIAFLSEGEERCIESADLEHVTRYEIGIEMA